LARGIVIGFLNIILQTLFGQPRRDAEPEEITLRKETSTISDLVNPISEEMTRLDYKPTVMKQYPRHALYYPDPILQKRISALNWAAGSLRRK
jgi:hypothetical protein